MSSGSVEGSRVRTAAEIQAGLTSFLDSVERSDLETGRRLLEVYCHSEMEFVSAIGSEIEGRTYRGIDGVASWFSEMAEAFDVTYADRDFRSPSDDVLLLLCTMKMRGRGSGLEVVQEIGVVWNLRDGYAVRSRSYPSHAEAIAAAESSDA